MQAIQPQLPSPPLTQHPLYATWLGDALSIGERLSALNFPIPFNGSGQRLHTMDQVVRYCRAYEDGGHHAETLQLVATELVRLGLADKQQSLAEQYATACERLGTSPTLYVDEFMNRVFAYRQNQLEPDWSQGKARHRKFFDHLIEHGPCSEADLIGQFWPKDAVKNTNINYRKMCSELNQLLANTRYSIHSDNQQIGVVDHATQAPAV